MESPERKGPTRREVLKGMGAIAAVATLQGDTMKNMALESALEEKNDKVDVPQRRFFQNALAKSLAGEGIAPKEQLEIQRIFNELIDSFIEQNLDHTKLFTSQETGATFPYAHLDSAEFAKQIYRKFHAEPTVKEKMESKRHHKEFIFSPIFGTDDGGGFSIWEEQFRQLTMRLPEALKALKEGKEPEHHEVYALGAPTNGVGVVTTEFEARVKEHGALKTFAELQSELVAKEIEGAHGKQDNTEIYFWGLSMGGSLAVAAAEKLIENGKVTQVARMDAQRALEDLTIEPEEKAHYETSLKVPHLSIRVDLSPGINEFVSRYRTFQGWKSTLYQDFVNTPYMRTFMLNNGKFQSNVNAELRKRHSDIELHMNSQEAAMKNGVIWPDISDKIAGLTGMMEDQRARSTLIGDVFSGSSLPERVKVTQVFGADDPYMKAIRAEMNQTLERFEKKDHTLGGNIMQRSAPRNRQFVADMRHFMPWLRPTELRRMTRAAKAVVALKNGQ